MIVTATMVKSDLSLGGIVIVCLIISLVSKEVLSNGGENMRLASLHRSLKLIWPPLIVATILIIGQQLVQIGVL